MASITSILIFISVITIKYPEQNKNPGRKGVFGSQLQVVAHHCENLRHLLHTTLKRREKMNARMPHGNCTMSKAPGNINSSLSYPTEPLVNLSETTSVLPKLCSPAQWATVGCPGDVCVLMLIPLPQEGLPRGRSESHTQVTSLGPSPHFNL